MSSGTFTAFATAVVFLFVPTEVIQRRGGFAFAVEPHREVRPESGLVGIAGHIVVNKR